jgi:hypothetical protein
LPKVLQANIIEEISSIILRWFLLDLPNYRLEVMAQSGYKLPKNNYDALTDLNTYNQIMEKF